MLLTLNQIGHILLVINRFYFQEYFLTFLYYFSTFLLISPSIFFKAIIDISAGKFNCEILKFKNIKQIFNLNCSLNVATFCDQFLVINRFSPPNFDD